MYVDKNCGRIECAYCNEAATSPSHKPQRFWMCWVSHKGSPMKRHPLYIEATAEAVRLARLPDNLGKKVYVLQATEYVQVDLENLPVSITGL